MSHTVILCAVLSLVSACSSLSLRSNKHVASSVPTKSVPIFEHIVVITFENKGYGKIINNPYMPTFNMYARDYTLLTQFYAVTHPSLPNYLAMIGGDTFNIQRNCKDCFINATSLPDLIEASGRTWKTYQEDMDTPCGLGTQDDGEYEQKHNPFVYFNTIRLNKVRCESSVVPLENLESDIRTGSLPNFIFITPNMCNDAHNCKLIVTDAWIFDKLNELIPALEKQSKKYLIVLNWDEGQDNASCCGLPKKGGGRIAVVLISPLVRSHYSDATPYSHYSLL
ncbi:MAG TPA: alkaline phosphatase family protein, partial [Anaerolineales bacterium]|nr:alkaline phosphatase family protein [Anaerolineales bacterium]